MSKKEQIEEIMLAIPQKIIAYDGNPKGQHLYGEQRLQIAEELANKGYHKTIWHKVADGDIPKHIGDIIMAIKLDDHIITTTGRYRLYDFYISDIRCIEKDKVIAWTELPQYKE